MIFVGDSVMFCIVVLIFLPSHGSEMSLNRMFFLLKTLEKSFMGVWKIK